MTQIYTDPTREMEPYALPNAEVFYFSQLEANYNLENLDHADEYTHLDRSWMVLVVMFSWMPTRWRSQWPIRYRIRGHCRCARLLNN